MAFLVTLNEKEKEEVPFQKKGNRKYRDASFTFIFGKPHGRKFLLQIANELFGTNYTNEDDGEITTFKNDVSFVITNRMI